MRTSRTLIGLAALALHVVASDLHAQSTTAGLPINVSITKALGVLAMNRLDFGSLMSTPDARSIVKEPASDGAGFLITGEVGRVVAVSCPATASLAHSSIPGESITFTPKFTLFTPQLQASSYVRGAGGCPSITLANAGGEGQMYLALGGTIAIGANQTGTFTGTYTISISYP